MQISFWRLMVISLFASAFPALVQAQSPKRVERADFGTTQDGAAVKLITLRNSTRIGERIEQLKPKMNGYDHNFILGEGKAMKLAARLVEPRSGRVMEVRTTQPAVQLYTANHLGHTAVCLETQHHPDAIHHKNFPSVVVRPREPLKETTLFTFLAR